jgi:hypothetical protein
MPDSAQKFSRVLSKAGKLNKEDLEVLRQNIGSIPQLRDGRGDWVVTRMEVELVDAITRLDETSTQLITTTNRLTRKILWLTVVGVAVALAGLLVAAATYLRR